jgi:hypothetical protein
MGDAYSQQSNYLQGPAKVCPGQEATYYHYAGSSSCYVSSWSVSSNATVLQYSYGTVPQFIKVRWNTSGTGWVSATLPGSQYCYSQTRYVEIGLQSVGNISGPTYVYCNNSSATYSIPPVTGAASYTWTVSGSLGFNTAAATYSNGGATVTFPVSNLSSGSGTVSVTVNASCGSAANVTRSKSVYRSEPSDAITGPQSVCPYREYTYYGPSGAYNGVWQVFAPNQPAVPTITYSSSYSATIRFPGSGGGYIQLTYTNACGSPNRILTYGWGITSCPYGSALADAALPGEDTKATLGLYPNPGYDLVKVMAKEKAPFTAKVYSPLNELVAQAPGKGGEAVLRVADLPAGIYYVHLVTDKGIVSRKRLVIRK